MNDQENDVVGRCRMVRSAGTGGWGSGDPPETSATEGLGLARAVRPVARAKTKTGAQNRPR